MNSQEIYKKMKEIGGDKDVINLFLIELNEQMGEFMERIGVMNEFLQEYRSRQAKKTMDTIFNLFEKGGLEKK